MKKICLVSGLLIISALMVLYAVNITVNQTVTQNFNTIGTSGTASLPDDWKADKNGTNVRYVGSYSSAGIKTEQVGGNGMTTSAPSGIYNFGAGAAGSATDRAVGGLSAKDKAKSVNIYVKLTNNGSSDISSFTIS